MKETWQVSEQQKILLMEQEIGQQMEKLIPEMQKMARSYDLRNERSPFRNVLDVATDPGGGIEVTKNFIRYQLGRSGANRIWANTSGGKNFAVALVDQIDELREVSRTIVEKMNKRLKTKLDDAWIQQVHERLMQLYLGNLVRYQVFLANEKEGK